MLGKCCPMLHPQENKLSLLVFDHLGPRCSLGNQLLLTPDSTELSLAIVGGSSMGATSGVMNP